VVAFIRATALISSLLKVRPHPALAHHWHSIATPKHPSPQPPRCSRWR